MDIGGFSDKSLGTVWAFLPGLFPDSSMVEQAAVNREVVGSSPTRGAK